MLNRPLSVLLLSAFASPVLAQAVISVHSGVVNFTEGSVSIDSQPVDQKPGKFATVNEGSELRTQAGSAEVLLTPNVILRVGENSAIRMVSNSFSDTQVEFLSGSAVLDSEKSAETPITILYKDYKVQSREDSTYRFDSESPRVSVLKGKARVSIHDESLVIGKDQVIALTGTLLAQKADSENDDALGRWVRERQDALAADNEAASKTTDDLSIAEGWQDGSDPGDLYSGVSPSPLTPMPPLGISPGSPVGPLSASPLSSFNSFSYSMINPYGTIMPSFPYAFGYYYVPVLVRPTRVGVIGHPLPVSVIGSRPVSGIPVWHPRPPTVLAPNRPVVARPGAIAAPHVSVGHR